MVLSRSIMSTFTRLYDGVFVFTVLNGRRLIWQRSRIELLEENRVELIKIKCCCQTWPLFPESTCFDSNFRCNVTGRLRPAPIYFLLQVIYPIGMSSRWTVNYGFLTGIRPSPTTVFAASYGSFMKRILADDWFSFMFFVSPREDLTSNVCCLCCDNCPLID